MIVSSIHMILQLRLPDISASKAMLFCMVDSVLSVIVLGLIVFYGLNFAVILDDHPAPLNSASSIVPALAGAYGVTFLQM